MSSIRKFHSIAALCGDGLRPELQALFERLAVDPHSELFARADGMVQSGPDPVAEQGPRAPRTRTPPCMFFSGENFSPWVERSAMPHSRGASRRPSLQAVGSGSEGAA